MAMRGAIDTLSQLQKFRLAGSFCDVTLTVGHDQVQAHRNVLAAGSEYFYTLFLGQFKEASMQNINLSEVTNSITVLENVVDFLYTQKVEINEDNLESLVKLSTFLLIDPLIARCMQFMKWKPNLRPWMDYYFLAVEHSLNEIEIKGNTILKSRCHDFFIHQDNLDLTPDEVQLLLNKDMFQYCTVSSVLQFVLKWLTDDATDQHVSVASQILDKMNTKATDCLSEQQKFERKQILLQVKEKLNNKTPGIKLFLEKSQKVLNQISPKLETASNCQEKESSCASMTNPSSDSEFVLVTLSPKQCVVDKLRQMSYWNRDGYRSSFKEPTFTLCSYMPSTKTWYHIQDFRNESAIVNLPKHYGKSYAVKAYLFKDKLALIHCHLGIIVHLYSLCNSLWQKFCLPECLSEGESVIDFCLVQGDDCVYLIVKMMVEGSEFGSYPIVPMAEYFMGFKLDEDWGTKRIFTTDVETDSLCENCELQASISSVSNELMFICGPTLHFAGNDLEEVSSSYVFIVNLNDRWPKAVNLLKELHQAPEEGLTGVRIMQTQNHFYIITDGTVECKTRDVQIAYEYKFQSQCLEKHLQLDESQQDDETESDQTEPLDDTIPKELDETNPQKETMTETETGLLDKIKPQGDETNALIKPQTSFKINQLEGKEEGLFPCCEQFTVSHRDTLWSFEGDRNFVSLLHEFKMEEDDEFVEVLSEEHTPPPFSCVSLLAVGELPKDLVAKWTPVEKFHHSNVKKSLAN